MNIIHTAVTLTSCIFCLLASAFDLLHNFGAEDDNTSHNDVDDGAGEDDVVHI